MWYPCDTHVMSMWCPWNYYYYYYYYYLKLWRCPLGERKVGNECNPINECLSNPCKNGGKCDDQIDRFTCKCLDAWKGDFCTIEQRPVMKPPLRFSVGAIIAILVCLLLILSEYRTIRCVCVPDYETLSSPFIIFSVFDVYTIHASLSQFVCLFRFPTIWEFYHCISGHFPNSFKSKFSKHAFLHLNNTLEICN